MRKTLIKLRRAKGLTQNQIALAIGISQTIVSYWESGRSRPSPKNLVGLASTLGITPEYLDTLFDRK